MDVTRMDGGRSLGEMHQRSGIVVHRDSAGRSGFFEKRSGAGRRPTIGLGRATDDEWTAALNMVPAPELTPERLRRASLVPAAVGEEPHGTRCAAEIRHKNAAVRQSDAVLKIQRRRRTAVPEDVHPMHRGRPDNAFVKSTHWLRKKQNKLPIRPTKELHATLGLSLVFR